MSREPKEVREQTMYLSLRQTVSPVHATTPSCLGTSSERSYPASLSSPHPGGHLLPQLLSFVAGVWHLLQQVAQCSSANLAASQVCAGEHHLELTVT